MSKNILVHIADRVLNRPLMILPDKLALIASVLEGRIGIDATELNEIEAVHLKDAPEASRFVGNCELADPLDPKSVKPYRTNKNGVAMIPVMGSLVNRGAWIGSRSGMSSYEGIKYQISTAAADPAVSSILLDMDSPGGEAVGAFEVADVVRTATKSKPVYAVVNGMAASAAYAIASAASQIFTTPSGVSGSVGVVLMHADYSHALHERGVKPTLIHAGARKVDGNPYQPLTDDVKAELKAEVDQFYDLFVSSVAKGRKGKMTEKSVRGTEARTFIGEKAVEAGLVDAIGSFETVLAELSSKSPVRIQPRKQSSGLYVEAQPAPTVAVRSAVDRAMIVEAGHRAGLDKVAVMLADISPKSCSTEAALEGIRILAAEQAKQRQNASLHASGLYLDKNLSVRGGALFVQPDAESGSPTSDFGWSDVVGKMNKKLS
jgi:signal peptide peptidase SppA